MGRSCSQNGRSRSAFKILTGKRTLMRNLGRARRRWEDNIRMDLKEIGIYTRNGLIQFGTGLLRSPWKYGVKASGSIS